MSAARVGGKRIKLLRSGPRKINAWEATRRMGNSVLVVSQTGRKSGYTVPTPLIRFRDGRSKGGGEPVEGRNPSEAPSRGKVCTDVRHWEKRESRKGDRGNPNGQ